mgnify:CR=1 FL=1
MIPAGALITGVVTLISKFFERKQVEAEGRIDIAKAETQAKVRRVLSEQEADQKWDEAQAEGSKDSWKDEFWTILLSIPLVMLFWPDPEINQIAASGFTRMDAAPDWYVGAVMLAIAAAFGYRKFVKPFLKGRLK